MLSKSTNSETSTSPTLANARQVFTDLLGRPVEWGAATSLRNGDEIFEAMLRAIRTASESVDFLTFVYWTGEIAQQVAEALAGRAKAGLKVRVLIDGFGGLKMDQALVELMKDAGCDVALFRPISLRRPVSSTRRTHRKILICDGKVGFTGGVGIAEEWTGDARDPNEWRDTHVQLEGSIVPILRSAFFSNWLEATGTHPLRLVERSGQTDVADGPPGSDAAVSEREVRLTGPFSEPETNGDVPMLVIAGASCVGTNDLYSHFRLLVGLARKTIKITTPYFMPDRDLIDDLLHAVARGVDVQILVPGEHIDKEIVRIANRADLTELTRNGVSIHRFLPTMLHAKIFVVDGEISSIGSANVNRRSASLDEEANVVIFDPEFAATLIRHFEEDLGRSDPLDPQDLDQPNMAAKLLAPISRRLRFFM